MLKKMDEAVDKIRTVSSGLNLLVSSMQVLLTELNLMPRCRFQEQGAA